MQSLTSPADHDSTYENCESEGETTRFPSEYTPLIPRHRPNRIRIWTPFFIIIIFLIFIFGVIIGTYLLVEEDKQWPVNVPFDVVSRNDWDKNFQKNISNPLIMLPATHIILSHTNTSTCENFLDCQKILVGMKETYKNPPYNMTDLPFNFMIGMDGETYEGRGWNTMGDLILAKNNKSLCLGVIGNFESMYPSKIQLNEIKAFINESIRRKKLIPTYRIIGRPFGSKPKMLFKSVMTWQHWSSMYS